MRTSFALVTATVVVGLSATDAARVSCAQGGGASKVVIDPEPRVAYAYGPNMRFGVSVVRDRAGKPIKDLLTFAPNGRTNTTVVRIDGKDQEFGGNAGKWTDKEVKVPADATRGARDGTKSTWTVGGLRFTQIVEIVAGKQPVELGPGVSKRLYDTCLVRYVIENPDSEPHKVGLRFQLDTLIGGNDGVPGLVTTKHDFATAKEVPDFVQALENPDLQKPGTIAHLTLKVGGKLNPPNRVSLTRWPEESHLDWDLPVRDMGIDSAVVMYWDERELKPGMQRTLGFAYGLGAVSSGEGGKLALTVSGDFEAGKEFTVAAYVRNPVKGETLSLTLPDGLQRTVGKDKEPVPPGGADGNSVVTWKVKAQRAGEFTVRAQSSRGLKASTIVTVTGPSVPTVPYASGKVIQLLVQKAGEKFGPAEDQLDTEVVFRLDSEPDRLLGFNLRDDGEARARQAMFDLLREAFRTPERIVHVNYQTAGGRTSATVTRLWVEKGTLPKPAGGK